MPTNKFGAMILTTAQGEAKTIKGWLRQFGTLHPLTLALIALVAGNILGVVTHV